MSTFPRVLLVICGLACLEAVLPAHAASPFHVLMPRTYGQRRIYNNGPRMQLTTKQYEVHVTAADDVTVRLKTPPPRFDLKGNPLKYSTDELKELKGKTTAEQRLPGYKSDFGDLKAGDIVNVVVDRVQPNPKDKEKKLHTPATTLAGVITTVDGSSKQVTLRVTSTEVKTPNFQQPGTNQNKVTLDPNQFVASSIMILVENPTDTSSTGPAKGKNK